MDNIYLDEPCVVSFFIGELGWICQRFQGYFRYLKHNVYPEHKFMIMTNIQYHPLIHDFVAYTIDLPEEFYNLGLEVDGYEAPLPNSQPGSLTLPDTYKNLIDYFRQYYNKDKTIEIWPPRGCNTIIDTKPQTFVKYTTTKTFDFDKPIITIFPRARKKASTRNVPHFVWKEVVDRLADSNQFKIILSGTPSGACLVDYEHENVVNLINYKSDDKLEETMDYICNSIITISSQSGPTHVSLLCDTPSYIIGHEKKRHTVVENRFQTPTSFRYVHDYRAIDVDTILSDVEGFIKILDEHGFLHKKQTVQAEFDETIEEGIRDINSILKSRAEE